ncbi:MAG: hypothetical protein AAGE96_20930 [Cyanobacteria bacterium P01_G01_bin.19]
MTPAKHFNKTSILSRTFWFLGGYGLFLILTILGGVYYIGSSLDRINQSTIELDELGRKVETLNQYFSRQAKERKNLLLRRHNLQDFQKYAARVNEMSDRIYLKIAEIEQNPLSVDYKADLKLFEIKYNRLLQMYDLSQEIFHNTQDYQKSDRFVRGYGGEVGKELFDIIVILK